MKTTTIIFDALFEVLKRDGHMVLKMNGEIVDWPQVSKRLKTYSREYEELADQG